MSNHKNRLAQLERKNKSKPKIKFRVTVQPITPEIRQAQKEAHARGEDYYIVEAQNEQL